ncbi:MAG TPA: glycerophosphodiester phosphodiesterase family protein [bacterium]|nr:glycerophosphodiester phosphodiesterase family protein [bacterium]
MKERHPFSSGKYKFLKIGHRGAAGYEPENTLRSFRKAFELGTDMAELDVHLCKTGELVVIHDDTVDRTTDGKGPVSETTLRELKKLDAGKGERIPLLSEVLELLGGRTAVNVELKGRGSARETADVLKKYVKTGWPPDLFLVSSFSIEELLAFRSIDRETRIGYCMDTKIPESRLKKLIFFSIHLSLDLATAANIRRFKREGYKVFVWTVNDRDTAARLIHAGADGLFSDFPDRIG